MGQRISSLFSNGATAPRRKNSGSNVERGDAENYVTGVSSTNTRINVQEPIEVKVNSSVPPTPMQGGKRRKTRGKKKGSRKHRK